MPAGTHRTHRRPGRRRRASCRLRSRLLRSTGARQRRSHRLHRGFLPNRRRRRRRSRLLPRGCRGKNSIGPGSCSLEVGRAACSIERSEQAAAGHDEKPARSRTRGRPTPPVPCDQIVAPVAWSSAYSVLARGDEHHSVDDQGDVDGVAGRVMVYAWVSGADDGAASAMKPSCAEILLDTRPPRLPAMPAHPPTSRSYRDRTLRPGHDEAGAPRGRRADHVWCTPCHSSRSQLQTPPGVNPLRVVQTALASTHEPTRRGS